MADAAANPCRKAEIINGALEMFCRQSIRDVGLEAIAVQTGCSRTSLICCYKNKENLVREAFRAYLLYTGGRIGAELKEGMSRSEAIEIILKHSLPPWQSTGSGLEGPINVSDMLGSAGMHMTPQQKARLLAAFFAHFEEDPGLKEVLREAYAWYVDELVRLFPESRDPEAAGHGYLAMMLGLSLLRVAGFLPPGGDNRGLALDFLRGCTPDATTAPHTVHVEVHDARVAARMASS